ncbi:MAG: sigma factor-like helix-turn-helix DNA-binding protein [Euzebya sp.]
MVGRWQSLRRQRRQHQGETRPDGSVDLEVDQAAELVVRAAVQALPERQRMAVVLRYLGDLSVVQTAEAMGCRPGTVKAPVSPGDTNPAYEL